MNPAITRVIALVTSSACLALGAGAHAEPKPLGGEPPRTTSASMPIDVVLVGRAGTDGSLAERIKSWFGPTATLSVAIEEKLVAERVLGPLPTKRVAVWVTERDVAKSPKGDNAGEARLYFAVTGETQAATRYLIRDVPLNRGFDEIGSERVAQVVHSSVTALIEGSVEVAERPEIERELAPLEPEKPSLARARKPIFVAVPPPKKKPPPEPQSSPGPPLRPLAGVFYKGAFGGEEGLSHGPGLALGATLGFGELGVGAVARGEYAFPHSENFEGLDITLSSLGARLGARGAWKPGPWQTDLELGGGSSWVRYDPEETALGPVPGARDTDQRYYGFGSIGLGHELGPLRMGVRFDLEIYDGRSQYKLTSGKEIGTSSRVKPAFSLEIVFE
jgi:hypothetical protein